MNAEPKHEFRFTRTFEKQLELVPAYIRSKAMQWVFMVELLGLSSVSQSKGFHDEPLKGKRRGQRSVRLNKSYRIIYKVIDNSIVIELLEVNKHDY